MRGRTNITQRSGTVPVNGDVKEFTVANGEVINVGDFVSFSKNINEPIAVEDYSGYLYSQQIYVNENTYILIVDNKKLSIIKDGVTIDSLSASAFVYLSTVNKILSIDSSKNISVYKIDESTSKLVFQYTQYVNVYGYDRSLFELDGCLLSLYYTSSGSDAKLFSVSDSEITLLQTLDLSRTEYFNGIGVGFFRNGILSVLSGRTGGTGGAGYISYFKLGENNTIVEDGYVTVNLFSSVPFGYIRNCSIIDSNSYIIQFSNGQRTTYSNDAKSLFVLLKYNNLDKIEVEYNFTPTGYVGVSAGSTEYPYKTDGKLISIIPLGNDKFLGLTSVALMNNSIRIEKSFGEDAQQNYSIIMYCIYEIKDGLLVQLTNWNELLKRREVILYTSYYSIRYFRPDISYFIKNGSEYKIIFGITSGLAGGSSDSNYYLSQLLSLTINIKNNDIVDLSGEVTSYNGNSLGFAKTGGTSGETIQVYVPKSN